MADLALLALTLAWGTTFLLVKNALAGTSAGVFLLLRFGVASAALAAVWLRRRDRPGPGLWRHGALLGLAMWGGFAFQTLGLLHTTPARSAFLTSLAVLFVPFLSRFLHRRAVPPSAWAGVALAVAGLAGLYRDAISAEVRWGDWLTLGCSVCYAFQIVWTAEWSGRHPLALLTAVQVATAWALSALLLPLEPLRLGSGPALWGTVAFTALAMTAGAFLVMNWAQRHTSAVRAGLIYSLEPVAAAAFSWRFGGEVLSAAQWSGGALIVAGVVVGEVGAALRARMRGVGPAV